MLSGCVPQICTKPVPAPTGAKGFAAEQRVSRRAAQARRAPCPTVTERTLPHSRTAEQEGLSFFWHPLCSPPNHAPAKHQPAQSWPRREQAWRRWGVVGQGPWKVQKVQRVPEGAESPRKCRDSHSNPPSAVGTGFSSRARCSAVDSLSGVWPPNWTMMPLGRSCGRARRARQQAKQAQQAQHATLGQALAGVLCARPGWLKSAKAGIVRLCALRTLLPPRCRGLHLHSQHQPRRPPRAPPQ